MTHISSICLVVHERDSRCSKAGVESKVVRFLKKGGGAGRKEGDKSQFFRAQSAPKLCLPLICTLLDCEVLILSSDTLIRDAGYKTIFLLKSTCLLTLSSP